MIKKIVTDRKVLSQPCKFVTNPEDVDPIVQDLKDTFAPFKDRGFGLSANQIGYDKSICYISYGKEEYILVNPEVVEVKEPLKITGEGCFSFPGIKVETKRYNYIKIINNGEVMEFQGLLGIIVQHEVDHLFGRTLFDRKWRAR